MKQYNEIFEYTDGHLYWRVRPNRRIIIGSKAGSDCNGYVYIKGHGYEHRVVFEMFNGYTPQEVDHINGDKADNRIENLREVSRRVNLLNKRASKGRALPIGVYTKRSKYRVQIDKKHIGTFDTANEAIDVASEYRAKLINKELHG